MSQDNREVCIYRSFNNNCIYGVAKMNHRWFVLDSDLVGNGFRALCYEDDHLKEAEHFDDRWSALEHGDKWTSDQSE